jgi:hypothetical protein
MSVKRKIMPLEMRTEMWEEVRRRTIVRVVGGRWVGAVESWSVGD